MPVARACLRRSGLRRLSADVSALWNELGVFDRLAEMRNVQHAGDATARQALVRDHGLHDVVERVFLKAE